jgi:hypothetical protein
VESSSSGSVRGAAGSALDGRPLTPWLEFEDIDVVIPRLAIKAHGADDQVAPTTEIVILLHRFEPGSRLGTVEVDIVENHASKRPVGRPSDQYGPPPRRRIGE